MREIKSPFAGTCGGGKDQSSCPYFNAIGTQRVPAGPNGEEVDLMMGECRRKPPTVHILPRRVDRPAGLDGAPAQAGIEPVPVSFFPQVTERDWCGHHPDVIGDVLLDQFEALAPDVFKLVSDLQRKITAD